MPRRHGQAQRFDELGRVTAELAEVDAELEALEEEWLAAAEIDA